MASSARMMVIGIVWLTGIFILAVLAFVGGVINKYMLDFFMQQTMAPQLAESAGLMWWFQPFYYTIIVVMAIVLTYACYAQTIIVTDYYPGGGTY
jgi:hypothetical protein